MGAKSYAVHKEEENGKMEYVVVEAAVMVSTEEVLTGGRGTLTH